jgi:hypothetical protein
MSQNIQNFTIDCLKIGFLGGFGERFKIGYFLLQKIKRDRQVEDTTRNLWKRMIGRKLF